MKRIVNFNIKNLCFFVHHFIQIVKNLCYGTFVKRYFYTKTENNKIYKKETKNDSSFLEIRRGINNFQQN